MRKLWTILALAALLLVACGREGTNQAKPAGASSTGSRSTPGPTPRHTSKRVVEQAAVSQVSLVRYDACPTLLSSLRAEALKRVGPYGLPGSGGNTSVAMDSGSVAGSAKTSGAEGAPAAVASQPLPQTDAPAFSGTNVQESNVDEPDVIKTNGRHIFTVRTEPGNDQRQRLTSVSVAGGKPSLAGGVLLPVAYGYELLLAGDRILAIGQGGGPAYPIEDGPGDAKIAGGGYQPYQPGTVIAVVDVSDPTNMRILNKLELDGSYASARMVDGIARMVLNSQSSRIAFDQPQSYTASAQRKALAANKLKIQKAGIDKWLPRFQLQDESGKVAAEGPLASCASTYHPKTFSGFGEMSVVTLDPANPSPRESASVVGAAGTIYASTSNLYVATQDWPEFEPLVGSDRPVQPQPVPEPTKTSLHRFDISDPTRAVYAASGEVRGTVLNQWSLSEHNGFLRVATTELRFSQKQEAPPSMSSFVTTYSATANKLTPAGSVNDLSPGEQIYGVRFIGDLGYVVTFKQIDPLHVIDLSDPAHPRVLGELEIPGYSAYLHPVGDGLLLGIGQDADTQGRALGVVVSLFDIRDSAQPKRVSKVVIEKASSQVQYDHHAFTWWAPSSLAVMPVEVPGDPRVGPTSFAYGFRVTDDAVTKAAKVSHNRHTGIDDAWLGQITRSIVIGDELYTFSGAGIASSDLNTFAERGWLRLA